MSNQIVIFKSAACADTIYFGDVAKRMMELIGKEVSDKGIVTVEQLPEAIARIKAAIEEDKAAHRKQIQEDEPGTEGDGRGGQRPRVTLTQRALPLLEMLERSLKEKKPVVWGV
jgi:hypothetical protein